MSQRWRRQHTSSPLSFSSPQQQLQGQISVLEKTGGDGGVDRGGDGVDRGDSDGVDRGDSDGVIHYF